MKDKEKDIILEILKREIANAKFAVEHCKVNGYGELQGQVKRLRDVNKAYCALIHSHNERNNHD